jgi:hypothetical protein
VNRVDHERDYTEFGLTDPEQLEALLRASRPRQRPSAPPVAPQPRSPLDDDLPSGPPAQDPGSRAAQIRAQMGWTFDERKQARCRTCLAGPGEPCVNPAGRPMRGVHPEGRGESTVRS